MDNREAVNWLINISADIGKAEHSDLWHYEQALTEIKDMLESAQPEKSTEKRTETHACDLISRQAAIDGKISIQCANGVEIYSDEAVPVEYLKALPSAQSEKQHGRIFQEIVVEYPSYNTYPEYKGKPYFSIKYTENGQEFIGYGTYKPEVLSEYLKEYFMPSAQPELDPEALIRTIEMGITATNSNDIYSLGMRNGMRWCKSLIDGVEPKFEDYVTSVDDWKKLPSAQPYTAEEIQKMQELESAQVERAYELGRESVQPTGTWLIHKWGDDAQCSNCGKTFKDVYDMDNYDQHCRHCGTHMKGIRAI